MPAHTLRTRRLVLRPLVASDAARLRDLIDDYDVAQWLTLVPHPYALADASAFIHHAATLRGQVWAITDAQGLQGMIGIEDEFGYWLGAAAWGQGYATEAGRTVIAAWFGRAAQGELASSYFVGNDRSRHVLEKLGFVDTGAGTHMSKARGGEVAARTMSLSRARWEQGRV